MRKTLPKFKNDAEMTKFVMSHDLGDYLEASDLKPISFNLKKQDQAISIRLSSELITILKKVAHFHKTKYQKLIRSILEENIGRYATP